MSNIQLYILHFLPNHADADVQSDPSHSLPAMNKAALIWESCCIYEILISFLLDMEGLLGHLIILYLIN